jgi:dCMP deaminase
MLSKKAEEKLESWKEFRVEFSRPSWDDTWMEYAEVISKRSHDAQTQVGCVIVGPDNILVSEGYNGFPRDIDDSRLPNLRPAKYIFFSALHSEVNAIYNAARTGRSTKDCKAYVNGPPCFECYIALWQAGITEVIYKDKNIHMINTDEDYIINMEILRELTEHKLTTRKYVVDDHQTKVYNRVIGKQH